MKEEVTGDIKFVTFTLALGAGAPQGAVALAEAEVSYKAKYLGYKVLVAQVVVATESSVQLFLMLAKE